MVKTKERVQSVLARIWGTPFYSARFICANGKRSVQDEGGVNKPRHEAIGLSNGSGEEGPPCAMHRIFLCGFLQGGAPDAPLETSGAK